MNNKHGGKKRMILQTAGIVCLIAAVAHLFYIFMYDAVLLELRLREQHYWRLLPVVILIALAMILLLTSSHIAMSLTRASYAELQASKEKLENSQEELRFQAEHDDFLQLYNRRTGEEMLRTTLKKDDKYSILMLDIDDFKELNEEYGHSGADDVLKTLAADLKSLCEYYNWMLCRYGGDEFLMMIPLERLDVGHPTLNKIYEVIHEPIAIGDSQVSLTFSIGISVADGETSPDQHVMNAELAMYEAKKRGRNGVFVYGDEMKAKLKEENRVKEALLRAFETDGFHMLYQPQVNSQTKTVSGFEALVRMKEPIYPGQFIPIAEKNGWIWKIGRITTELVIKQIAEWRKAGLPLHPVSVNFSSNQLNDRGYVQFVKDKLDEYNVPSKYLELEITEGLFLEKTAQAEGLFESFKELGMRLLMDDFGTGYSSLGYLTYIPVDVIKLDKSLVDAYLVDGKDSFIRDVIQMVHDLDKEVIIEGVEEEWQYERLKEFHADTIQGYYFSKPIPASDAVEFQPK